MTGPTGSGKGAAAAAIGPRLAIAAARRDPDPQRRIEPSGGLAAALAFLSVGAGLAATRCLFAKPASSEPASNGRSLDVASYDEVDAYVEGEMCRLNIPGVSLAIVEGDQLEGMIFFHHGDESDFVAERSRG